MRRLSCRFVPITYSPPSSADALAEADVGAAAGHVGRDGHRAALARLGDDRGLALVVARVQDLVRHVRQQRAAAARTPRRSPSPPAPAGRSRAPGGSRAAPPAPSPPWSGRSRPDDRRGSRAGWSGSSPRPGRRLCGTRATAWRRCPSCRRPAGRAPTRCWSVIWPRIMPCDLAATPSLASMAVCSPAGQRRSCAIRPLNSSTISMAPFLTM